VTFVTYLNLSSWQIHPALRKIIRGFIMQYPMSVMLILASSLLTQSSFAENESLYTSRSLSLELAYRAADGAIKECRKRGYSVAVAVVDRGGNLTTLLRDRFAGPHTIQTATQKAWTANSFRQSTALLADLLKAGRIPDQVQHNPGALLVGGGLVITAQGETIGGIGVSGAPPGSSEQDSIDGACAESGLEAIWEDLELAE
jgi:uncharacterized protein GlcG (DUF336 family)